MTNRQWIVTDYCKENIKQLGFLFDPYLEEWTYSFPVLTWKRVPTLVCKVIVSRDKDFICINVVDAFGHLYPPYYNREYGRYDKYIKTVDRKILYKLKSLGIIEKKIKNKEKENYGRKESYWKSSKSKVSRRRS